MVDIGRESEGGSRSERENVKDRHGFNEGRVGWQGKGEGRRG